MLDKATQFRVDKSDFVRPIYLLAASVKKRTHMKSWRFILKLVLIVLISLVLVYSALAWITFFAWPIKVTSLACGILGLIILLPFIFYTSKIRRKSILKISLLLSIESLSFLLYSYYQPQCEPCLTCDDCPPCLSDFQIAFVWVGTIALIFFIMTYLFRKNASR